MTYSRPTSVVDNCVRRTNLFWTPFVI